MTERQLQKAIDALQPENCQVLKRITSKWMKAAATASSDAFGRRQAARLCMSGGILSVLAAVKGDSNAKFSLINALKQSFLVDIDSADEALCKRKFLESILIWIFYQRVHGKSEHGWCYWWFLKFSPRFQMTTVEDTDIDTSPAVLLLMSERFLTGCLKVLRTIIASIVCFRRTAVSSPAARRSPEISRDSVGLSWKGGRGHCHSQPIKRGGCQTHCEKLCQILQIYWRRGACFVYPFIDSGPFTADQCSFRSSDARTYRFSSRIPKFNTNLSRRLPQE